MSPKAMRRAGSTSPRDPGARMRIFMKFLCERSSLRVSNKRAMPLQSASRLQLPPAPRSIAQPQPPREHEPDEERLAHETFDHPDQQPPFRTHRNEHDHNE